MAGRRSWATVREESILRDILTLTGLDVETGSRVGDRRLQLARRPPRQDDRRAIDPTTSTSDQILKPPCTELSSGRMTDRQPPSMDAIWNWRRSCGGKPLHDPRSRSQTLSSLLALILAAVTLRPSPALAARSPQQVQHRAVTPAASTAPDAPASNLVAALDFNPLTPSRLLHIEGLNWLALGSRPP